MKYPFTVNIYVGDVIILISLLRVGVQAVTCINDILRGDIIRYLYFGPCHGAVVLETVVQRFGIGCKIAHYAWHFVLCQRRIIEETITIPMDGSFSVLLYRPPTYDVYEADVARAMSRIGEEQFVFFSNDSSHFSRWYKLKLIDPCFKIQRRVKC
ncbi:hypothetical protein MAR_035033 [Mya arenaria]|uniref:Uncharacterized protein n=1 Tax=Mya arenaria TaxID=6604 RepID=A0ABY7ELV6_MYAAR|nr:hypothetical protein MAR_035033 [Mya arenaria]